MKIFRRLFFVEQKKDLLYAVISGILLALSFPPLPFNFFAFVGFVPLLFVLYKKEIYQNRYFLIYITFFIYHTGANWWISSWSKETDPYLLISGLALDFFHPFFFFLPFWLFFTIKKRIGSNVALFAFPFIFSSFEWLHSLTDLSYPWLTIGYTQMTNLYWIQFIDKSSISGGTFLIIIDKIFILRMIIIYNDSQPINFLDLIIKSKQTAISLVSLALILFLPYFYTIFILPKFDYIKNLQNNKHITIGLVQPNINPWGKWSKSAIDQIQLQFNLSDSLLNSNGDVDLLLWSETAIPYTYLELNSLQNLSILSNWVNQRNVNLLTGIAEFYIYPKNSKPSQWAKQFPFDSTQFYETYNASVLIEHNKIYSKSQEPQTYRKTRLTPFAENFPLRTLFPFAAKWFMWGVGISNWSIGEGAKNFKLSIDSFTTQIGNIICIESIYPNYVRTFTEKGANILSIITNDAWYDHTVGPRQHYLIACARAIENRRYIARVGNSGISGFISHFGNSLEELPQYKTGAKAMMLPLLSGKSLYVKYGDWLPYFTTFVSLLLVIYALIFNNRK
jgi:apolipoprotein N-acyltransferase